MMKEIGSEFWNVPIQKHENTNIFNCDAQWFISGRSALRAIIRDLENKPKSVALPSWCCDSMIRPFLLEGIEVKFYPIYFEHGIKQDIRTDCDMILVMDYFGYGHTTLNTDKIVIRDLTHNIFSLKRNDADYYFGSLRKWCGIWTGGFAWGKGLSFNNQRIEYVDYNDTRKKAMNLKTDYIAGKIQEKSFLTVFSKAENMLEECEVYSAAERDIQMAKKLDVKFIKEKRRENAKYILDSLADIAMFPELGEEECPLFVPIMLPNRDELRQHLIENQVYCPVHWPMTDLHKLSDREKIIYDTELSLICDQRYDLEDMERLVKLVKDGVK